MLYVCVSCYVISFTSFDKLTHLSVDTVQRAISLLQNYSIADGGPADIIYDSFILLSKESSMCLQLLTRIYERVLYFMSSSIQFSVP